MSKCLILVYGLILLGQLRLAAFVAREKKQILEFSEEISFPLKEVVVRPKVKLSKNNQFLESSFYPYQIKKDIKTNEVRVITGDLGLVSLNNPVVSDYVAVAFDFVEKHQQLMKISISDLNLVENATLISDDVQFITFAISRHNIPIADAQLNFRFKKKRLVQVVNYSYSEAEEIPTLALFNEKQVKTIVQQVTQSSNIGNPTVMYRVKESDKGYDLVKVSHLDVSTRQYEHLSVQVDHTTGGVFEMRDHLHYLEDESKSELHFHNLEGEAKADMHERWYEDPLQDIPLPHLQVDIKDTYTLTDQAGFFQANQDTRPNLLSGLRGPFVTVKNMKGQAIRQTADLVDDRWMLYIQKPVSDDSHWKDPVVAQNMIFYHVNRMVSHAKKYIQSPWFDESLVANANLRSTCNAHWDGRTINFYSGNAQCANTALIADVIYHEWGHGLDANTGGIQDGAFSEGIGDIMSLIMTQSNLLGIGFRVQDFAPVRDLEPDKVYPRDRGEVHAEGLIIGSTFWDLFKAFRDKYDATQAVDWVSRYIFNVVYTARTYLDVYDALLVIDDDDDDLRNGTPHGCLINDIFVAHGLAEEDVACLLATVEQVDIEDTDNDQVIEPGEVIAVNVWAKNSSNTVLENLEGTLELIEPVEGIEVVEESFQWGSILPQTSAVNENPVLLRLSDDVSCGSEFSVNIHLFADQREVFYQQSFLVGVNDAVAFEANAAGLPLPILDRQTTSVDLDVVDDAWQSNTIIYHAQLAFDIRHTYVGDVTIRLKSPEGQVIDIYKGSGRGQDVNFNQDITKKLKGIKGSGKWQLIVNHSAPRDEGFLDRVSFRLTPASFRCDVSTPTSKG